ncbi:MAG: hypothetical protein ACXVAX_04280 [Pseudobdellovibrio sp.]
MSHLWVLYDPVKETQSDKLTTEEAQFVILRLKTKLIDKYLIWREDWPKWKKLNSFLDSEESPFMSVVPLGGRESAPPPPPAAQVKAKPGAGAEPLKMSPADGDTISRVKASFEVSDVKLTEVSMVEAFGKTKNQFDGDQFSSDQIVEMMPDGQQKAGVGFDFKSLNKVTAFSKKAASASHKIELLLIHPKGTLFRSTAQDISLTGTFSEKIIPSEFHNGIFEVVIINNMINDDEYKRITLKGSIVVTDSRTYIRYVNPTDEQKANLRAGLDYYLRAMKRLSSET